MASLSNLKAVQLRRLLTQIGAKSGGTKPQMLARLQRELAGESKASQPPSPAVQRILSVDMGIKNLAFCLADVGTPRSRDREGAKPPPLSMHVTAWKRISLLRSPPPPPPPPPSPSVVASSSCSDDPEHPGTTVPDDADTTDAFAPSALSTTAYTLVKDVLLPYEPHAILIERQRWRSASQPSVQEWTLRVNLLEGMIWAVLRALGCRDGVLPRIDVESVLPGRVAGFWVPGARKVEKGDKIAVVKGWVERQGEGSGNGKEGDGEVRVSFGGEAERTRAVFAAKSNGKGNGKGRVKRSVPVTAVLGAEGKRVEGMDVEEDVGKLDDLADCLLQAAAWAKWKGNKGLLGTIWQDELKLQHFLASLPG